MAEDEFQDNASVTELVGPDIYLIPLSHPANSTGKGGGVANTPKGSNQFQRESARFLMLNICHVVLNSEHKDNKIK